ncbi:MAG: DNA repair protein RecO [Planctomycetes bacterium]|nr:DNA repair protein RecO [Planctomycetota bacterium]
MPTIKDNAVCLRLMDWSETSQIVVLMTESHGKISAVAKGAKRTNASTLAKFSGGVELLTTGEAVLIVKPQSDLANLIEWNLVEAHWHLRRSYASYQLAMYAADLVHHVVQDHDPHPGTYAALAGFLEALKNAQPQAALMKFQWAVIDDMGYRPVLDHDAQTGEVFDDAAGTLAFSASAGGLVADTGAADRWRVRRQTVDLLRDEAGGRGIEAYDDPSIRRANRLLCVYLRAILDKELATMSAVLGEE